MKKRTEELLVAGLIGVVEVLKRNHHAINCAGVEELARIGDELRVELDAGGGEFADEEPCDTVDSDGGEIN